MLEGTLTEGVKAIQRFKPDGTSVLEAWNDTFPRTWEVRGDGQYCETVDSHADCYTIERDTKAGNKFRARDVKTGEILEFTLTAGKPTAITGRETRKGSPSRPSSAGGAAQPSADEIAKTLANPNTPLAQLTFKNQFRTFEGNLPNADDQDSFTLLFQPNFPFKRQNDGMVFFPTRHPAEFQSARF